MVAAERRIDRWRSRCTEVGAEEEARAGEGRGGCRKACRLQKQIAAWCTDGGDEEEARAMRGARGAAGSSRCGDIQARQPSTPQDAPSRGDGGVRVKTSER